MKTCMVKNEFAIRHLNAVQRLDDMEEFETTQVFGYEPCVQDTKDSCPEIWFQFYVNGQRIAFRCNPSFFRHNFKQIPSHNTVGRF